MRRSVEEPVAPALSPAARARLRKLEGALGPRAERVARRLERRLRGRRYQQAERQALMALMPVAAVGPLGEFFARARVAAAALAESRVTPAEVLELARECDRMVEEAVAGAFRPAREQLLLGIAMVVNGAYYEAREAQARALVEQVKELAARARRAEEEERRRIGRELHDEAAQELLLLRLKLELLEKAVPPGLKAEAGEVRRLAERIIVELRRLIAALGPEVLERIGIGAALRQLGVRFRKQSPAALQMRIEAPPGRLPREVEEVIYRVAQEGLQNVAKHSGAQQVKISLRVADMVIRLRIQDDGSGFDEGAASVKAGSYGLAGMKERAALVGGKLEVRTRPGAGTVLLLTLDRRTAGT
jgi:signal transduction histidine kinase